MQIKCYNEFADQSKYNEANVIKRVTEYYTIVNGTSTTKVTGSFLKILRSELIKIFVCLLGINTTLNNITAVSFTGDPRDVR